jgi:hypothetical protein
MPTEAKLLVSEKPNWILWFARCSLDTLENSYDRENSCGLGIKYLDRQNLVVLCSWNLCTLLVKWNQHLLL